MVKIHQLINVVLLCFCSMVWALPEDKDALIHVHAGSADLNQQARRGIYKDGVTFEQGSTHLRAEEAETHGDKNNQLTCLIVKGSAKRQAHYWTLTEEGKPPLHAYADTIYYYPQKHVLKLVGRALVKQGKNTFRAPSIQVDTLKHHVISKREGESPVVMTFDPEGYKPA